MEFAPDTNAKCRLQEQQRQAEATEQQHVLVLNPQEAHAEARDKGHAEAE
jgi:hypothetical protein